MSHGETELPAENTPARFRLPFVVLALPLLESLLILWAFLPYRAINIFIISMSSLHRDFGTSTAYVGIATLVVVAFRLLSVPFGAMLIVMLFKHNRRFHSIVLYYLWAHVVVAMFSMIVRLICLSFDSLPDWSAWLALAAAIAFTVYSRKSVDYARVFKHNDLDALAIRPHESG